MSIRKMIKFFEILTKIILLVTFLFFTLHRINNQNRKEMKTVKLTKGDRVQIIHSENENAIGKFGTVMYCSHVRYGILLDGETRPQTNACSEFAVYEYLKRNLQKI